MVVAQAIRFIHRLQRATRKNRATSLSSTDAAGAAYKQRTLRQQIDAAAFQVYGHWVKREEQQNRMTLFQNQEKQNTPIHPAPDDDDLPVFEF